MSEMFEKISKEINDKVKYIEQLTQEVAKLSEYVEKLQSKVEEKEEKFPKNQDEFFYITSDCSVADGYYSDEDDSYVAMVEAGNCFKTRKEAEDVVERIQALKRVRDYGFEFKGVSLPARRIKFDIRVADIIDPDLYSLMWDDMHLLFDKKGESGGTDER